jgi:uncharacterized protein (TIGR03083 family)
MPDVVEVYHHARQDLCDFLQSRSEEELATEVPACPGWTIKDTVAHLSGVAADSAAGSVPEGLMNVWVDESARGLLNEWTEGQVADRRSLSLEEIATRWEKDSTDLVSMIQGKTQLPEGAPPFPDRVLITDLAAHTQDIYGALGLQRDREGVPVKLGLSSYIATLDIRLKMSGRPAVQIDAGERQWVAGEGEPQATVKGTRFELFRALSGRRGIDQLRELPWVGDPEAFVDMFYPYGLRTEPIEE